MATLDQPTTPQVPSGSVGRSLVRPLLFLAMLGAIGAAGYFAVTAMTGQDNNELTATMLTFDVTKGDLLVTVKEDGELASANNVEVKCQVAGGSTIIYIVEDGSIVQEGDLLIELDKSSLEDQINQQRITTENARAAVIQAQQDVNVAQISIEEYEEGTFKQEEQDADAQIKIAMENLRSAENTLAHAERMFRKGYVSKLELETQEFAVERAQLELDSAETAKDVLVNFTKRKTLEDLNAKFDIAEAKLSSENSAFALEESKLQRLEDQIEQCTIYAPTSGMVVYSNAEGSRFGGSSGVTIEEGAAVRERQSIIKLPDLANMQVNVKVHESKVENIERELRALVRVQGRELAGSVVSVANQPEATSRWEGNVKEYKTIVKIDGEPSELRPGMTAEVEILVANLKDVVIVPTSAVVESGVDYYCWVAKGNKLEKRRLEIGMTDGEFVEIRGGLEVDETVVRNPRAVVEEAKESAAVEEEDPLSKFGSAPEGSPGQGGSSGRQGGGESANGGRGGRGGEGAGSRGEGGGSRGEGGGRGGEGGGRGGEGGGRGGSGGSRGGGMMQMDTDGDGKISKDEAPSFLKDRFDTMDLNSDGFIDEDEVNKAMEAFRSGGGF